MTTAFTGDLENLHIVDIIQLLHTTRKSGTFTVEREGKGKSRIVFSNGYIVSASHLDNRIYIGTVLLKMGLIDRQTLEKALEIQKSAGKDRKPLLTTLIEMGAIGKEDALKGLRKLIEITIVELVGWKEGGFTFEPETVRVSEKSDYMPGEMEEDISLDAQMVLMDALRVYDERERDRSMGKEVPSYEEVFADYENMPRPLPEIDKETPAKKEITEEPVEMEPVPEGAATVITAADLGLDNVDALKKKLPRTLMDRESFDPGEIHRQQIKEILSGFSPEAQNRFISFLERAKAFGIISARESTGAIILLSNDPVVKHALMSIYKKEGIMVFSAGSFKDADHYLSQCLAKSIVPVLIYDNPETPLTEAFQSGRDKLRTNYPQIPVIFLSSLMTYTEILEAYRHGARTIIPRPNISPDNDNSMEELIMFIETLKYYIGNCLEEQQQLKSRAMELKRLDHLSLKLLSSNDPNSIPRLVTEHLNEIFSRTIMFLKKQNTLVSDQLFGKDRINIPLKGPSIVSTVVTKGIVRFGAIEDETLEKYIYGTIPPPSNPLKLLLPLKKGQTCLGLLYADFGNAEPPSTIDPLIFDIISNMSSLALENSLYRKRLTGTVKNKISK